MTYFLAALSDDKAQICMETARTSDAAIAAMIEAAWKAQGYKVNRWQED